MTSRDIPIIFSAAMIRAFQDGRKMMTRRLAQRELKAKKKGRIAAGLGYTPSAWTKAEPGDRLWVRENVTRFDKGSCDQHVWYWAGRNEAYVDMVGDPDAQWPKNMEGPGRGAPYSVPSIYMPRWASRLTLVVTATKVERLNDISEADALAEGVERRGHRDYWAGENRGTDAVGCFTALWQSLHGMASWRENPEVVAISLDVIKANIDAPEARAA